MNRAMSYAMQRRTISELQGERIYFTEADVDSQTLYSITYDQLLLKLKVWLLLVDYIMLAGSHPFKSNLTYLLLRNHPELLTSRAIVPDIRTSCTTFTEYIPLKQEEGDAYFLDPTNIAAVQDVARFLDDYTDTAVTWTAEPVQQAYKEAILYDLNDQHSVLRKKLVGTSKDDICRFSDALAHTEDPSRPATIQLARQYFHRKHRVLERYTNLMYYIQGARHLECAPVMHDTAFQWGCQRIVQDGVPPRLSNEDSLYQTVLDDLHLSESILNALTIQDILEFRKEHVSKQFRHKWSNLLQKALQGYRIDNHTLAADCAQYDIALRDLLCEVIKEEKRKLVLYKKIRSVVGVGSLITGLFTGGAAGAAAGVAGFDPLLDKLQVWFGGTEVSLFSTKLWQKAVAKT